jgi:hypothetical protein
MPLQAVLACRVNLVRHVVKTTLKRVSCGEGAVRGRHSIEGGHHALDRMALRTACLNHLAYEIQQTADHLLVAEVPELCHHMIDIWEEQEDILFHAKVGPIQVPIIPGNVSLITSTISWGS